MKAIIKGFLVCKAYDFLEKPEYDFWSHEPSSESADVVSIRPMEIEADVPDNFDPRPGQIACLERAKQELRAEFAKRITEFDARISKLLALENAT